MILSLSNLRPSVKRKPVRRRGRGVSAGQGAYSGKGIKGQHARSGGSHPAGFEGGRSSIIVQTPKARGKGFRSPRPRFHSVRLEKLNAFSDGESVTRAALLKRGIVRRTVGRIKIVGGGDLKKKLVVYLPASKGAYEAVKKSGGSVKADDSQGA